MWSGLKIPLLLVASVSSAPSLADRPHDPRQDASPRADGGSPLDDELLEGLSAEPRQGASPLGPGRTKGPSPTTANGDHPLVLLSENMRQVEVRLRRGNIDLETQGLQAQIIEELDRLISQAQRHTPGQSLQPSLRGVPGDPRSSEKPPTGDTPAAGTPGTPSAGESQAQSGPAGARTSNGAHVRELIKNLWGQLPSRVREQTSQPTTEKFLPQYELLIEDYFRALSEGMARRADQPSKLAPGDRKP